MVRYLNNHMKFRKLKKNNKNHNFNLITDVSMATSDAQLEFLTFSEILMQNIGLIDHGTL